MSQEEQHGYWGIQKNRGEATDELEFRGCHKCTERLRYNVSLAKRSC